MLKAVDGATEKHVKHARAASTSILHSTKAALATGSANEVHGSPYQRHEGIKHEAAGTTACSLSPNVSDFGLLYPACTRVWRVLRRHASWRQRRALWSTRVWHLELRVHACRRACACRRPCPATVLARYCCRGRIAPPACAQLCSVHSHS